MEEELELLIFLQSTKYNLKDFGGRTEFTSKKETIEATVDASYLL